MAAYNRDSRSRTRELDYLSVLICIFDFQGRDSKDLLASVSVYHDERVAPKKCS